MKLKTQAWLNLITITARAISPFILGILVLFLFLEDPINLNYWLLLIPLGLCILGVYLCYHAYRSYKTVQTIDPEADIPDPLAHLSDNGKIAYLYRTILIFIAACTVLSIWVWYDISALEAGEVDSISLYFPISLGYELGGFWGGVLTLPVIMLIIVGFGWKRINEVKINQAKQNSVLDADI
jgi:MFS family permease